jgi:hypothetical protein
VDTESAQVDKNMIGGQGGGKRGELIRTDDDDDNALNCSNKNFNFLTKLYNSRPVAFIL